MNNRSSILAWLLGGLLLLVSIACALPGGGFFPLAANPSPTTAPAATPTQAPAASPTVAALPPSATLPSPSPSPPPPSATPTTLPTAQTTAPSDWAPTVRLSSGRIAEFRELRMVTEQQGWALGCVGDDASSCTWRVLVTKDGGLTWHDMTPPRLPSEDVGWDWQPIFTNGESAWVACFASPLSMGVWSTHDWGHTWQWSPLPFPEDFPFPSDISRITDGAAINQEQAVLFLLGGQGASMSSTVSLVYATRDGGKSWQYLYFMDRMASESDLAFSPDGSAGWMTTYAAPVAGNSIAVTQDGGASWSGGLYFEHGEDSCSSFEPVVWGPGDGVALEECLGNQGFVYIVAVWEQGALVASTQIGLGPPHAKNPSLDFPTRNEGYLALETEAHNTLLFASSDGGANWQQIKTLAWRGQAFSWLPGGKGWAAADNGKEVRLVRTTNGGRTWELLPPPVLALPPGASTPWPTATPAQPHEGPEGGAVVLPPDPSATAKLLPPLDAWELWTKPGSTVAGNNQVTWTTLPGWGEVLDLSRTEGGADGGGAGVFYARPIDVTGYTHLYLSLRGNILEEAGGNIANTNPAWFPEGGLQVWIHYTDAGGQSHKWFHGFYITDVDNPDPRFTHEQANTPFLWQSPDLLIAFPAPAVRIDRIEVLGFGWQFHSQVIGVNLFGTPR